MPMRGERLNESLFYSIDYARSAIAEWREDFNTARPHSSLDYRTPAADTEFLAATGSPRALWRNRNSRGSRRGWMKVQA